MSQICRLVSAGHNGLKTFMILIWLFKEVPPSELSFSVKSAHKKLIQILVSTNKKAVFWNLDQSFSCWHDEKKETSELDTSSDSLHFHEILFRFSVFDRFLDFRQDLLACQNKKCYFKMIFSPFWLHRAELGTVVSKGSLTSCDLSSRRFLFKWSAYNARWRRQKPIKIFKNANPPFHLA